MWSRLRAAATAAALIGVSSVQAQTPQNPVHESLLKMKPPERAAWLARTAGKWCVGTNPFLMGVSESGPSAGNAYWSFSCLGAGDYVVQIDPLSGGVAIDCESFKEAGGGKECFKKF